jgi:hypothetical protein
VRPLKIAVLASVLLSPLPAPADFYRCESAGGGVVFVDDPSRCEGATKHVLTREIAEGAPARRSNARRPEASLEDLLPDASEIGAEWLITLEDAITEMDLVQQQMGLLEIHARHYGRSEAGATEVCSIELWRFAEASQASAAEASVSFPGWSFEAKGALLITLRGVRFARGQPLRKGLFPACRALGALVDGLYG